MQLLKRILVRGGHALWAQKGFLVLGVAVIAALFAYLEIYTPTQVGAGASAQSAQGDCADTVMAALASNGGANGSNGSSADTGSGGSTIVARGSGVQQQAYQCMDPTFQQQVSEQQFASRLQASTAGRSITHVARVGSYDAPSGTQLVYYAVDAGNQSVGFIIYIGGNGKVLNIE
jgi:hypothetical protein